MSKEVPSRQVRVSDAAYNIIRKIAFKRHVPMVEVLEEAIQNYDFSLAAKQD